MNRSGLSRIKQEVALKIMEYLNFDPDAKDGFAKRGKELAEAAHMDKVAEEAFMGVVAVCKRYYELIDRTGSYNRLPVRIENRDALNVNIKLYEGTATDPVEQSSFTLWNTGGVKIDFSAGFMWTRLVDHEFTKVYDRTVVKRDSTFADGDTTVTVTNVDKYTIAQQDGSDFRIGAGLMAHAYWRTGGVVNPGIGAGFMINNGSVVNYLLGANFGLGRESRVVISTGFAFGKVDRLKTGTRVGADVEPGSTEVPTEEVWQTDLFVGVGLNFGKAKAPGPTTGTP